MGWERGTKDFDVQGCAPFGTYVGGFNLGERENEGIMGSEEGGSMGGSRYVVGMLKREERGRG